MNKLIKNTMAICLSISIFLPCYPASAYSTIHTEWGLDTEAATLTATADSGSCGDSMKWVLDDSGTLTISGSGMMHNYVDFANNSVTIPWFENNNAAAIKKIVVENGVESISDMAFYGTSIASLKLPDSVKSIGIGSIANCQNLTVVVLSDSITELPEVVFNCDGNLEAVKMPANLKSIGEEAFIHCWKLKDIVIPASVTDIKDLAFFDCPLLNEIVIPDKITTVKMGSFESCDALRSVIFPPGLTKVEEAAFSNCANLEEIILPDSLVEIGENAFSYSEKDRDSNLSKQKVYVPKSVKTIGRNGIGRDSVIYGFKNSTAEKYAKENKIEFMEITESLYDADSYNTVKAKYYSKSAPTIKEAATTEAAFPDCDSESVTELTEWGVLSGDENGNFRPDDLLTRAEFSTMVSISTGVNEWKETDMPQESSFSDVGRDYWGFKYIVYSTNCAYLDGFEDGTFRPGENVTFAQAVKICLSAIGYNAMIDKSAETSAWYEPWIKIAYDYGLIDTTDENPNREISREEAADMIHTTVNMPLCIVNGFNATTGVHSFRLCDGKEDENGEVTPFDTLYRRFIR